MILLKDGHLIYQGKSDLALKYFSVIGCSIPAFCNPFDFFLEVLSDNQKYSSTLKDLNSNYQKLCEAEVVEEKIINHQKFKELEIPSLTIHGTRQVSWCLEFYLLLKRTVTDIFRNRLLFFSRFLNVLFNTLIIMGFYWNIGSTDKKDQLIKNYIGFFFNNVNQFFINGMYNALFAIPVVKNILKREYSAKLYRISAFFVAYIIASLINSFMYAIIFTPITFFSTNLLMQTTGENVKVFSTFFGLDFFIYTLGQFYGLLLGGSLPEHVCYMVSPLMFILFMLGAGVYRGNSSLPSFISWLFYTSPYKYFLELELKNFQNFSEITKIIPNILDFNYGLEVCIPALIGMMMSVLILGYFGIRSYSAKF